MGETLGHIVLDVLIPIVLIAASVWLDARVDWWPFWIPAFFWGLALGLVVVAWRHWENLRDLWNTEI